MPAASRFPWAGPAALALMAAASLGAAVRLQGREPAFPAPPAALQGLLWMEAQKLMAAPAPPGEERQQAFSGRLREAWPGWQGGQALPEGFPAAQVWEEAKALAAPPEPTEAERRDRAQRFARHLDRLLAPWQAALEASQDEGRAQHRAGVQALQLAGALSGALCLLLGWMTRRHLAREARQQPAPSRPPPPRVPARAPAPARPGPIPKAQPSPPKAPAPVPPAPAPTPLPQPEPEEQAYFFLSLKERRTQPPSSS